MRGTFEEKRNMESQMKPLQRNRDHEIDNRIFKIREKYVMIDRDLAQLYGLETKVLNQQVKRNIERFPDNFMFKLNKEEFDELVTFCDRFNTMKHSSALPNAFTEQGVAMLSAVLKSNTAIKVSIRIMESFVRMRRFFISYHDLFNKLELLESRQKTTENQVEKILDIIHEREKELPEQGIFFDGQIYDAYSFVCSLIRKAVKRIILIDNYIDETILTLIDKRHKNVEAVIYTCNISRQLKLDIEKHNSQYRPIDIRIFTKAHDRFLIIDNEVYLIGASIKDLGKKWFGFTIIESIDAEEIIHRLNY